MAHPLFLQNKRMIIGEYLNFFVRLRTFNIGSRFLIVLGDNFKSQKNKLLAYPRQVLKEFP